MNIPKLSNHKTAFSISSNNVSKKLVDLRCMFNKALTALHSPNAKKDSFRPSAPILAKDLKILFTIYMESKKNM